MASKSKRRRRVLGASCILAALIVGASSFAWFTSSDEVTNRLTATADYGVSIAEDFTPPANWVPGQKVDKNVAVVNTGNVDAFVRTWLEGEMRILKEKSDVLKWKTTDNGIDAGATKVLEPTSSIDGTTITNLTPVTETDMLKLGFTHSYDVTSGSTTTKNYLKALSKEFVTNPDTQNNTNLTTTQAFNEIMAVQAGGNLVYVPSGNGTTFKFKTPNQAISVTNSAGAIVTLEPNTEYTAKVDSAATANITSTYTAGTPNTGTITIQTLADLPNGAIDSDTFVPITTGLYVFKRNEDKTGNEHTTNEDPEFAGYYYVKKASTDNGGEGTYFALHNGVKSGDTDRSDNTLPQDAWTYTESPANSGKYVFAPTDELALFTASRTLVENGNLTWGLSGTKLTATYDAGTDADTTDDVIIDITLANLGDAQENWKAITGGTGAKPLYTFYYNNDVEEGATTARLVDDLTLNQAVTEKAFIAFDFDLNVFMESQQVTLAENGKEMATPVATWAATSGRNNVGAEITNKTAGTASTYATGDSEISVVGWKNIT